MKNVILHTKLVQMIQTIATKYHQQQFEMFIRRLLALNLAHTCRFGRQTQRDAWYKLHSLKNRLISHKVTQTLYFVYDAKLQKTAFQWLINRYFAHQLVRTLEGVYSETARNNLIANWAYSMVLKRVGIAIRYVHRQVYQKLKLLKMFKRYILTDIISSLTGLQLQVNVRKSCQTQMKIFIYRKLAYELHLALRSIYVHRHQAVTKIQSIYRGVKERELYQNYQVVRQKEVSRIAANRDKAASKLAGIFRGIAVRARYKKLVFLRKKVRVRIIAQNV